MVKMKKKVTIQVLKLWLMMMSDMVYRNFFVLSNVIVAL